MLNVTFLFISRISESWYLTNTIASIVNEKMR
jgi:hypothetical protein